MTQESINILSTEVNQHFNKQEFSLALHKIKSFVECIICDPSLDGIVLDSAILDDLCLQAGKKIAGHLPCIAEQKNTNTVLYVATELYLSGGHTAVLEDFIKAQPDHSHAILFTNLFEKENQDEIRKRFEVLPVTLEWCPKKKIDLVEKILWLQKKWIEINPQKVFLFNHHQDVVAIAAAQPKMPGQLFFFHHADYQLTLGMHLSHALHIDFYDFLYKRCREEFGITNNIYYPLVVIDGGCKVADSFMPEGKLHTCSSGSMGKYDKQYLYSYFDLLPRILKATNGMHTHIGYLSDSLLEKIKKSLAVNQISQDRFIYVPWVNNLWGFLLEQQVDLYIASFPIGGGRAAVEVMGAGIPIVFHNNYRAPFLGGAIQYPGALFWREEMVLLEWLSSLDKQKLIEESLVARKCYESYHQVALLAKAFSSSQMAHVCSPNVVTDAKADKDLLIKDLVSGSVGKNVRIFKLNEGILKLNEDILKLNEQINYLARERDSIRLIFRLLGRWVVKFLFFRGKNTNAH